MGPAREYQNALDRIFTTCINGLEDSVSWNDSDSLRLLAKVLSSVDGLEHDALIALSAQFSSLDQKPEFNEDSNETKAVDDADKEESSTKAPEEEHTATDEKSTEVNSVQEETNANKETTASPESDGDLADFWCGCDGTCNKYTKSWTEPYYLCLICTNTDLCAKCHSKRLDWNSQGGESKWTTFCGKNHHYIRGPVAGWKGIKSGVIRIGEDEIPVKRWIRELKEERWPKAWERFWVRESGLKDIQ